MIGVTACLLIVGGIGILMCIHAIALERRVVALTADLTRRARDIDTLDQTVIVQKQTIDVQHHNIVRLKAELTRLRHYGWS